MLSALLKALPQLASVAMLLFLILFFFAVIGLQLFIGKFNTRCIQEGSGSLLDILASIHALA